MSNWENRSQRLEQEESGLHQNLYLQHEYHIRNSIGSTLFNRLWCHEPANKEHDGQTTDVLFGGKYACVHYISQVLILLQEGLWVEPAGTWMKCIRTDLELSGWSPVSENEAVAGDIILWDMFDGNEHVGFVWHLDQAVSIAREDPSDVNSSKSPQVHPRYFDDPSRVDGPRTINSFWTHPKLRWSLDNQSV